jgi:hypothetical protein
MTTAISLQRGRGKGRNPWRIREFLDNRGETVTSLAAKAGVKVTKASDTIRGVGNHFRVLAALEAMGCPRDLLYPRIHGREEAAA